MKRRYMMTFGAIVAVTLVTTGCDDERTGNVGAVTTDTPKAKPGGEQPPAKDSPAPTPPR